MKIPGRVNRPNSKWVTDVTDFNAKGDKLNLSSVLDLFNWEIIAYETHENLRMLLVSGMLKKALSKIVNGEEPMIHLDQGWHYQMASYQRQLASRGPTKTKSIKGNCLENAAMESFSGTLK